MKKNYSLLLVPVVVLILSLFSILGLQSVAAVQVDTSYAQSCTNDFIKFIKTNNSFKAKDYFLFHEKAFVNGSLDFKTDYYYYPTGNFIQIKSVVTYKPNANTQEKRNITFTIPGKYTGKTTIDYDYNDKQSNTLQEHSVINMTTYDGTNASFTKTGGGFSESQKDTNWWVNYAFIIADNMSYKNKRTDTGLYSFGFCGMCESGAAIPRTIPATFAENGESNRVICPFCALIRKSGKGVAQVQSASLSPTAFYYDGKVKTPTVTVKDKNAKTLKNKTDYTVTYASGRKAIGKYAVKVKFTGNYSGSKTLYFTIKPCKTQISKITAGNKALAIKWNKVSPATGYQIQYATNSSFTSAKTVTVKGATTTSKTIGSLASGKRYYVRMRTYKSTTYGDEKLVLYSGWSTTRNSPTLPSGVTLSELVCGTKSFLAKWPQQSVTGYQLQYSLKSNFSSAKTVTVKNATSEQQIAVKLTVRKLTVNKNYYVRIRTYKTFSKVNYFSAWSKTYKVKTMPPTVKAISLRNVVTDASKNPPVWYHVIEWKKAAEDVTGYQVQYGMPKNWYAGVPAKWLGTKNLKGIKTTVCKFRGSGMGDDVGMARVRAYYYEGGKYYYGAWSNTVYLP